MRIVRINAVYGIRSTGGFVKEIHEAALQAGYESYVFSADIPKSFLGCKDLYQIGNRSDHKVHALLSRVAGLQGYFSTKATKRLINSLAEIKPDVVHLHNLHANYINIKLLLGFLAKKDIPTVITLHDCWFYTGKCTHYTSVGCDKWKMSCGGCPKLKDDNTSWLFDNTKKMIDDKRKLFGAIPRLAVIGVSDWITNEAKSSILGDARIIRRVYNWVNEDLICSDDSSISDLLEEYDINAQLPTVLFIASKWSESKGANDLVWILNKFNRNTVNVVVVGNTESDHIRNGDHVWIKETHDKKFLAALYRISDVFVNLSREETFGRVSVEAALNGCKIFSYPGTANNEVVDTFNGIMSNNKEGIFEGVIGYVNSACFVSGKIVPGPDKNSDLFGKHNCMSQYFQVYRDVIAPLTLSNSRSQI